MFVRLEPNLNFLNRFFFLTKIPDIKLEGNPSSASRANGQKDMTKLIGALREYAKASKKRKK